MNILMASTLYLPHIGGIEYHVEHLSRELAKKGHNLTILTSMLPGNKIRHLESNSNGCQIIRLKTFFPIGYIYPSLASQGFALDISSTIRSIVKEKRIEIIHVHGHHYYLTWQAITTAKRMGIPCVLTIHGLYALGSSALAQAEEEVFNRIFFKQELKNVSATIGLTSLITDYAKKYGPSSNKYMTIPNGVDYQVFDENRRNRSFYRKKYLIGDDQIVVLFRGRFASIKGVLELAKAAQLVVKENRRVLFLFVGGGPLFTELSRALEPISENSRIITWTPLDEICELYLASDIFILPSKSEALPLTILEAIAAGLFIITTPVGGIPEVLQTYTSKKFMHTTNPLEISSTILDSIKNTLSKNQLMNLTIFDWKNIASKVEDVYFTIKDDEKNLITNNYFTNKARTYV